MGVSYLYHMLKLLPLRSLFCQYAILLPWHEIFFTRFGQWEVFVLINKILNKVKGILDIFLYLIDRCFVACFV